MLTIEGENVNDIYNTALWRMKVCGEVEESRNGKVKVVPEPVTTIYHKPLQRMLFDVKRNANPFFHVMESIWMLAGRNDVEFPAKFAANIETYSDDGVILNGAYGHRWRRHFMSDQVSEIIKMISSDRTTRRAVIGMWDPLTDLQQTGTSKDVPCNTHIYFRVRGATLDMTVCNRSNDIIWGCYGANAVHMSFLHEFVANCTDLFVGDYTQISNNWHIYEPHFELLESIDDAPLGLYPPDWVHCDVMDAAHDTQDKFLSDADKFCTAIVEGKLYESYESSYINWVAQPMAKAWFSYKAGYVTRPISYAKTIKDTAVQVACLQWLGRRLK